MTKYILFDNDGVLVDTEHWYFMSNKEALSELGFDLDKDSYLEDMSKGISCWERVRVSGIDEVTISETRQKRNLYYQHYLITEDIEIPGVEKILKELSGAFRMATITTSKRSDFKLIHKDRNITTFMDFVLTNEDYDKSKPHPEPYLKGLERFGAQRAKAVVVEDSGRGLQSAVAAGIDCIVVHNEFTKTHNFSAATHKIRNLEGLLSILGG